MTADRMTFLRAQRADLGRLLAACELNDASRIGFESRLADVHEEISREADRAGRAAELGVRAATLRMFTSEKTVTLDDAQAPDAARKRTPE